MARLRHIMSDGREPLPLSTRRFSRGEVVTITPKAGGSLKGKVARVQGERYTVELDDGTRYRAHLSELNGSLHHKE